MSQLFKTHAEITIVINGYIRDQKLHIPQDIEKEVGTKFYSN